MSAIEVALTAFQKSLLVKTFTEVERQVLRNETIAQISFQSKSLKIMIKLFVSEMEGEGVLYVAPLDTSLGYRESDAWRSWWELAKDLNDNHEHIRVALEKLSNLPFPKNHSAAQLDASLEWLLANTSLISKFINLSSS